MVVPVPDGTSSTLADHFMQHVLMKFGMCYLVVLDDGTPLKKYVLLCVSLLILL